MMVTYFERHLGHTLAVVWLIILMGTVVIGPGELLKNQLALTLVSSLISVIIIITVFMKSLRRMDSIICDYVQADAEAFIDAEYFTRNIILARKRPLVAILTSPQATAQEAAELVRKCLIIENIEGYRLIFLGAASLQTPTANLEERQISRSEKEASPDQVYHGALEEIASKSLKVGRFVSLLEVDEFNNRSSEVRNRYLVWLISQLSQMKRNPNYVLIDSIRAPKWGALGAMIISSEQLIQFSHPSGAVLSIHDPRITTALVRSSISEIEQSKIENLNAYVKSSDGIVADSSIYNISNLEMFSMRISKYKETLRIPTKTASDSD